MSQDDGSRTAGGSSGPRALTTAVPSSLTIEAFDADITTWRRWLQRLQGVFMIFNIQDEDRVPYLLYYVGPAMFDILCVRLDPDDPFRQTFERLTSILEEYYDPPSLEIAENFRFHQRRQESSENVQQLALHKLSIHCKFGDYLKTALRNQLVFGLASKKIQTHLLEKKDLTYEEALKIVTAMEFSEKGSESFQMSMTPPTVQVDVVQAGRRHQRKSGLSKPRNSQEGKTTSNFCNNVNARSNNYRSNVNYASNYDDLKSDKMFKCFRCGRGHLAS